MMVENFQITTHAPEQTQQTGFDIGQLAQAGDVILLVGNLGSGKTCLTQGIAWGIGFEDFATSPSFVLLKEYPGRINLYHVDFYRLDNIDEIAEMGFDDYLYANGISVIEWADRAMESLPEEHLFIKLEYLTENERRLHFEAKGKRYTELLRQLKVKWNLS